VIVHLGRHEGQKAIPDLVRAAGILVREGHPLLLLQAGRAGNDTANIEAAVARERIGDRVRFLGQRADVGDILAAGDVFAFPSLYEGLGGSLIEAMALGLPIVATRVPAIAETVDEGRNAALVRVGEPADLAKALGALLSDPQRRQVWGWRSRKRFEERYTLGDVANRMVEFYQRSMPRDPTK